MSRIVPPPHLYSCCSLNQKYPLLHPCVNNSLHPSKTQLKILPPSYNLSKEGGAYTTLRIPVAVCVFPYSCLIGVTSRLGLGLSLKSLKVKWVWNSSEYCIKENWEEAPVITLKKMPLLPLSQLPGGPTEVLKHSSLQIPPYYTLPSLLLPQQEKICPSSHLSVLELRDDTWVSSPLPTPIGQSCPIYRELEEYCGRIQTEQKRESWKKTVINWQFVKVCNWRRREKWQPGCYVLDSLIRAIP